MNTYIPVEKLIAEIERRLKIVEPHKDIFELAAACWQELIWMKDYVTSLQQEQPKLPGYNKALLEVKSKVDELYEETSIGLSEYDSGLYNGIAETCMKLRGFIKARLNSDEQPEVDLEKEIDEYFGDGGQWKSGFCVGKNGFLKIARHFYELGLKARKEE